MVCTSDNRVRVVNAGTPSLITQPEGGKRMGQITRRQFVKGSVIAGLGMTVATPASRVRGANSDIRVAVVGINGRGGSHISAFGDMKGVRLVALCDVDEKVLGDRAQAFEKKSGRKVETYVSIRT